MVKIGTDTAAMEAGFKKADGLIAKNAEKFKKAGRAMTVAGAAVTGIVGMMVKTASDAQETYTKFGTVFKDVFSEAERSANDLASSYGLSTYAAKDMLGATGDLLTGLGVMPGVALDLSKKTQQLAVDLASFTNFSGGAKGASEALTKAMLGERESLKSLGIVVTQEMVNEQLLAAGKDNLTGLSKKQAEAEATLAIAYSQSKNAVGDYERTSGDLANVGRLLMNRLQDLAALIGTQLIPVVTSIATKAKDVVEKVTAWVKENPKLTGTIVKIAAAVGLLSAVLGPILIMLPGIAAGMAMLSKSATLMAVKAKILAAVNSLLGTSFTVMLGPISLIMIAIAALIAITVLIVKNWSKIKDFFCDLWTGISGFFVTAFDNIKKKLLDWAIAIVGVLEKIPIVEKLAGPWKESLESMRAEMDKTVANVSEGMAAITASSMSAGVDCVAAFDDITGGLGRISGSATEAATVIAVANKKIVALTQTMVNEIKKATLDDYTYSKEMLDQKLADRIIAIGAEEATEDEKNKALAAARASHYAEMKALDKTHSDAAVEASKAEADKKREIDLNAAIQKKELRDALFAEQTEWNAANIAEQEELVASLNQLEMSRFQYANWLLDEKYRKEKETTTNRLLLDKEYDVQKKALEDAAYEEKLRKIEDEEAERKASLERTLANISMVLGAIGGLFQMSYQNNMIRIDNEEKRRLEAIDNQYNAQIEALTAIEEAEKAKTKEVLDAINREYDDKKQHILDNMEDNEARDAMLEELEQTREDRLTQARIIREIAEEEAAQAVIDIEEAKNEAIRIASEDLEAKRAAARRTAAKQEKAVALLSAIVNTAAAVTKALPNIPLAIAVGVLGAVQIALISSKPIPMKEGGIVMRPTQAVIGEAGPEAVIPLSKLGGGLQPAPVYVKMSVYNYGDINNAGDLDEISDRLARRMTRQLERGRRS